MNWAIGHGSSGGRFARKCGKCRIKTRTNSLLQSQNVVSSSRSSSGVSNSEEKVVTGVSTICLTDDTACFFFRTGDFMAILPRIVDRGSGQVGIGQSESYKLSNAAGVA